MNRLMLKMVQQFKATDELGTYIAPIIGWVFSVDGRPGTNYDNSFMFGLEGGLRLFLGEAWGLQGGAQWTYYEAKGAGFTPDTDLSGIVFFLGAFISFGGSSSSASGLQTQ